MLTKMRKVVGSSKSKYDKIERYILFFHQFCLRNKTSSAEVFLAIRSSQQTKLLQEVLKIYIKEEYNRSESKKRKDVHVPCADMLWSLVDHHPSAFWALF